MNSKFIQSAVQKWLYDRSNVYQATNYCRSGYFESDILAVTPAMIVTEIEIKVSVSDYRADFKKTHKHYRMQNPLANVNSKVPNRFFYACPAGMLNTSHNIPAYAGLIWVHENGTVEMVKQAPVIHKIKADQKLIIGMLNQLTQKSIYGGICKMTFDNNIRKAEFEKYEAEKVRKTKEFIDYWKERKPERFK